MKKKIMFAMLAAVMMLFVAVPFSGSAEASSPSDQKVLFDMGNGKTVWSDPVVLTSADTIDDVLKQTALVNGMTYASSGGVIEINGSSETVIGAAGSGGSVKVPGTTGDTVTSIWSACAWNGTEWVPADITDAYDGGAICAAFYPAGIVPIVTPDFPYSWSMIRGNAEQTGEQNYVPSSAEEAAVEWANAIGRSVGTYGVYASVLTVQNYIFVKYGTAQNTNYNSFVKCFDVSDLSAGPVWEFEYLGIVVYEVTTPVIAGEYIYVQSGEGYIYKFPWKNGPGVNNADVTTFNGIAFDDIDLAEDLRIPRDNLGLEGFRYSTGPASMAFDSGCIYLTSSNGMVYCYDTDLYLIWSYQMNGSSYYFAPTVFDGYLTVGALNGHLYILDKADGGEIADETVYQRDVRGQKFGSVAPPSVLRDGGKYVLIFSISDGRGMDSTVGGIGVYEFDPVTGTLTKKRLITETFGMTSNYLQPVVNSEFKGVYFPASKGFYRIDISGNWQLLNSSLYPIKAPPTLVNGESIYLISYQPNRPMYEMGLDGTIISMFTPRTTVSNYAMSQIVVAGGMLFFGNDSGVIAVSGILPSYVEPEPDDSPWWLPLLLLIIAIIAIIALIYAAMRLKGIKKPFSHLRGKMSHYVGGDDLRHNTRSKHRLLIMIIAGAVISFIVFVVCLCIGATYTMSVGEMFSSLFSAISKGGSALNYNELMVYESRLPRTLMALIVGIGLSIAGCMYQAIIRNPLVDPYIMGVSAGAGTAAVAVIAFNFTLFGLFSPHSIYLTAVCAIIGGIAAFFATMLIAEKSGGSSINYVLAGVVIGLALSSFQTVMLSMAGHQVANALQWLFGSFANVSWNHVRLIVFPVLALAIIPLFWAREFNLVLLGEDQAKQMGLNVKKFSRSMLIMASALTALCVAFVGIIGFVGLVIPHLCRMILGGDHRLVLPASIAIGGALMMFADLIARTAYYGQELPVGAITTMIGVPVFAWLLIRRGKMYDG